MNHYFIIISEETSLSIWPKVVSDTCSEAFQCFRCSGKSKQCNILYHIAYFSGVVLIPLVDAEEAVVLAKWLETICLDVASRDPTDEHKAFLDYFTSALQKKQLVNVFLFLRLRAAVFINLVGMRRALNSPLNGYLDLTPANLAALQRANYLFHSAHN